MPVKRLGGGECGGEMSGMDALELLCLVEDGGAGVHCLHAEHLVIALLVVEHRRRKVVKHVLRREWAMRLCRCQHAKR